MNNFIVVPSSELEAYLTSLHFERSVQVNEVVYVRKSKRNPDVKIKVYTSIRVGQTQARACGKDAIRVCAVFENSRKSFGIGKFPPVFRVTSVQSVLSRIKLRILDAAKRGNEWISNQESKHSSSFNREWVQMKNEASMVEADRSHLLDTSILQ